MWGRENVGFIFIRVFLFLHSVPFNIYIVPSRVYVYIGTHRLGILLLLYILNRILIENMNDSVYAQATVEADKKFGRIARRTRLFYRKNI